MNSIVRIYYVANYAMGVLKISVTSSCESGNMSSAFVEFLAVFSMIPMQRDL